MTKRATKTPKPTKARKARETASNAELAAADSDPVRRAPVVRRPPAPAVDPVTLCPVEPER